MRLFGKVDGSVDRYERASWITCPFDLALTAAATTSLFEMAAIEIYDPIVASEIYDPVRAVEVYIGGGGDAVQLSP